MKKVLETDHSFVPIGGNTYDREETWWKNYKCSHCGIRGRKYAKDDSFIYVTDSFSDRRIEDCQKDNFVDKYLGTQIKVCRKIHHFPQIQIYSIHTVVKPPAPYLNGENGVWIDVPGEDVPIQILFDESIPHPLPRHRPFQFKEPERVKHKLPMFLRPRRTRTTVVKRKRTSTPKRVRTRTPTPVKRIRTR